MTSTRITREALYDLVWRTPMSRLAAQFGVSDVALGKTCRRLAIPRPGRGHWAQVAAGLKVTRTPLGKAPANAKEWTLVTPVETPIARPAKEQTPEVAIPTDLRDAPDAIRRLGSALGAATKDEYERLVVPDARAPVLAVTIATHRRALLLLAALASAAQARGHSLVWREDGDARKLSIALGQDSLDISIIERLEEKDHVLTPQEEKRAATGYRWGIPKHDHFAGGRLQLVLHGSSRTQNSWSDTKTRTLDRQLGTVLIAAEREAIRRRDDRLAEERRRAENEQRRVIEEQDRKRQRLREARAKYQDQLSADLRRMARAWSEADEIRRFINAAREALSHAERTERADAWLSWAEEYVNALNPLTHVGDVTKETNPSDEDLSDLM